MKSITLTEEELNECLQAMQEHREMNDNELVSVKLPKDNYILNITTKDGELILFNITTKDGELVLFNIITEGKLLFDEEVIFIFIFNDVIKAGKKNGEVIEIDNIISKIISK